MNSLMGIEGDHVTNPQKLISHALWCHHKTIMGRRKIQILYCVWHTCMWNSFITSTPSYHGYNMENTYRIAHDNNVPKNIAYNVNQVHT